MFFLKYPDASDAVAVVRGQDPPFLPPSESSRFLPLCFLDSVVVANVSKIKQRQHPLVLMQRQQVNITNGWTVACQHGGQWRECDDFASILQKAA